MRRKTESFTGTRPVFTGSPSIVQGGFNLDVAKQHFAVGDIIPAGTLAIRDEEKRTVQIIKTAKVKSVEEDTKTVNLYVNEFFAPCFAVGDKVLKLPISGKIEAAPTVTKVIENGNSYAIVLDKPASGWTDGNIIQEVVDSSTNAAEIGKANCVTICDVTVGEFETAVDVSADTMQYALYERRVAPIPDTQKDSTKTMLAANPHVKLTSSH